MDIRFLPMYSRNVIAKLETNPLQSSKLNQSNHLFKTDSMKGRKPVFQLCGKRYKTTPDRVYKKKNTLERVRLQNSQ